MEIAISLPGTSSPRTRCSSRIVLASDAIVLQYRGPVRAPGSEPCPVPGTGHGRSRRGGDQLERLTTRKVPERTWPQSPCPVPGPGQGLEAQECSDPFDGIEIAVGGDRV